MELEKAETRSGPPPPLDVADMDVEFAPSHAPNGSMHSAGTRGSLRSSFSDTAPNLKLKLDELFFFWLTRPDTRKLLERIVEEANAGHDIRVLAPKSHAASTTSPATHSAHPASNDTPARANASSLSPIPILGSPHAITSSPKSPVSRFISAHLSFPSPASPLLKGRTAASFSADPASGSLLSLEPSIALGPAPLTVDAPPAAPPSPVADLSRRRSDLSERDAGHATAADAAAAAAAAARASPHKYKRTIPPFYFPISKCTVEQDARERQLVAHFFARTEGREGAAAGSSATSGQTRPGRNDIAELVVDAVGLPSFFSGVVYDRIMKDRAAALTKEMFIEYFDVEFAGWSRPMRLFRALLNSAERDFLVSSDFQPLIDALLVCHPGLAFLQATPEFQQRYAETVIERIFYRCARRCDSKLYLADIVRSKLLDTLMTVDEEEDINRERKFFSYEHFYVLYCRFWELDQDHDLLINRDDLLRYGGHSLTFRVVDRIFEGCGRPLDCKEDDRMSYTDFIWFCLSEEDKTSETAIDYWFRCVDLDGDGLVTMYDIEHFYTEQLHRMECLGHEPVQLEDILCQLLDMIKPNVEPPQIRRSALRQCRLASNFFNVLFNLNKFFSLESRDPLQIRQEHATPELTDWDRFATIEYLRLSAEEEGEDEMEEGWDDIDENRMLELQEPQF